MENKENLEMTEETVNEEVKEKTQQEEEQQTPEQRQAFIDDWNEHNKETGVLRFDPPTKEELEAAVQEFKDAVEVLNKKMYCLADANNAVRVATFLKKWNEEDVQWEKDLWQGTIMFDSIAKSFLSECRKEPKDFMVNYQTLVYLFLCMQNTHGVGLKSALHRNKINEEFVHILDTVGDLIEEYKAENKKVERLQYRWGVLESGYYITMTEPEAEQTIVRAAEPLNIPEQS